ncbi:hypothetical protein [Cognatiyoonia sp. IB215182]|nr:hypothetical protein [Cognatiyoonia sp. IB215182]MDX8355716.1 hypothetical protein [Cognatiyoonia sp. IB215182]
MSESVKATEDKVASHHSTDHLDSIKGLFDRMEQRRIDGRAVK